MSIDPKLYTACIKGNRKAQFDLYKKYYAVMMGVAIRYQSNKEDAQAMVNVGFMKIFVNIKKYNTAVPFEAWIRRIMINTLIDDFRKKQKQNALFEHTDFTDLNGAEYGFSFNEAEQNLDAAQLEAMIAQLPKMTRNVFNLFAIDGYKHAEIAAIFGISIGTSKWHLNNARKKLIALMNETLYPVASPLKKEANEK